MEKIFDPVKGFKFGCDPELFVMYKGQPVSAAGLIPGTKSESFKVERGAVQVDGMAAEFNIDPAESFGEWDKNITTVMSQLEEMLPKGHTLSPAPSVRFSPEVFNSAPDEAKTLGCSPDFNAWTGGLNVPPSRADDPYLCGGAGHVHVGWTEDGDTSDLQHIMNCRDLVKQFDWFLGAWSLKEDIDKERRNLYGKAGACRYKPYGVEYRVLSNFWVRNRVLRLEVWNRMQLAISSMAKNFLPDRVMPGYSEILIECINTSNRAASLEEAFNYPINTTDARFKTF